MRWNRRWHAAQQGRAIRELPAETGLSVPFTPEELAAYRAKVLRDHPVLAGRKLVLMYPGGGILPERAWPAEHYARVARGLCDAGYAVGLIGLKDDAALAARPHSPGRQRRCAST